MTNFLQISEPEAANLDQQSATQGNDERLKNIATNALVSQYGPEAADPQLQQAAVTANTDQQTAAGKIAATNATSADQQAAIQRESELRAAYGVQSAIKGGMDPAAAFDQIVTPNASALGLSDSDAAVLRQHIVQNPQAIDGLITSLAGPAKPEGMPVMYGKANGEQGAAYITDRGTTDNLDLPQGSTIKSKVAGAPIQVDMGNGQYALVQHDQYGNLTATDINGTPLQGENAQAALRRAAAMQQNATTNAYSAGVRANNTDYGAPTGTAPGAPGVPAGPNAALKNAIIGQESRGNPNVANSSAGARGVGQIMPATFAKFALPGESITNPADNAAVSGRILDSYMTKYGDPARAAVAYFSGPANVAPPGSKTPYIRDAKDTNGTSTSTYVSQVLGRMGGAAGAAVQGATQAAPAAQQPLFNTLPPKGRQLAVSAAQGLANGAQQLASIDGQIDNIQKMTGPFSVGLGSLTDAIPGTPAANMKAALTTLRAQGLTSWLGSLKNASGSTGIGRVLQSEATAAMNSFGALEQSQSEDQFRYHLGIFQQRVHQLQHNAESAFKTQYGVDPYSAIGVPQPASPAANSHVSDADLLAKYGVH